MENFSVVIPTLNEEANIATVIGGIRNVGNPEIIVVDESSDRTPEIAEKLGAKVIRRTGKSDLSRSVVKGLEEASNDYVIVMDGDGQHPPEKISEILEALEDSGIVIGTRKEVIGKWRLYRRAMSVGSTFLTKLLFPRCRDLEDPISGFFGIRTDHVNLDELDPKGYKILVEILAGNDLTVAEIEYRFDQRENGQSSIGPAAVLDFLFHMAGLKYRQIKHK